MNVGVARFTDKVYRSLKKRYIKRMKWIIYKQVPKNNRKSITTYIVWDQIEIPNRVKELLSKGPNFVPERAGIWETSYQEIERGIRGLDPVEKDYIRWKTVLKNQDKGKREDYSKDIRYTKGWLKENNLIAARADKSKQIVIMKKQTYDRALEEYIRKTECIKVNSNIVQTIDRRVKKLEETKLAKILPFLRKCRNPRPGLPRLFAFAKTHKEGKEIRPIVEKRKGPTFLLEKRLQEYVSALMESNKFVVKDPVMVVKDLQSITLMDEEVGTVLDYESMYPSIKVESCVEALLEFLFKENPTLTQHRKEVMEMANLVCCESFFVYEDQTFKQKRGVPMGSPISGLLCELVVRKVELKVLRGFERDIVYYKRYVDDIFILWKNNRVIANFVDRINENEEGLSLKLEQKSSRMLHFLDINIVFRKGHISTGVFIKPTHSPLYIPASSYDPYKYKLAAFRALIRRAFIYCENVIDRLTEIERIIRIAGTLGYKRKVIEGIIRKFETSSDKDTRRGPYRYTKFTFNKYLGGIMKEIASLKDARVILKRAPNLYKILRNDKGLVKKEDKAGVYKIPYENQLLGINKEYVGVTTRNLGIRMKEHKYDIRKGSNTTVLAQMGQAEGSVVRWNEARIIKQVHSPTLARTAEKMEIYRSKLKDKCINARDAEGLPSAWKYALKNL
ncbi:uncharacterized protein [Centruroides vittatus]|uniref:uncharacterized protein n=1 Tax=Centruroides vittatus TaxID=120091 RepID=UPI0035103215